MRLRPLFWLAVSLLCFIGAICFWNLGERWKAQKAAHTVQSDKPQATARKPEVTVESSNPSPIALLPLSQTTNHVSPVINKARLKYRLSNTDKTAGQLARVDQAILLANALIDSTKPLMEIPAELKSQDDPGAYIVQARGVINEQFRAQIRGAGGSIVAYIPNNAFLVRASSVTAQSLASLPATLLVIPYEPYYKLDSRLLAMAMEQEPLREGTALNLVLFPDSTSRISTLEALKGQGATVLSEGRSPFGPIITVKPAANGVIELASLPGIQAMEIVSKRIPANDLSRARLSVATNSVTANNYLGLTGSNVVVNINDTGVDATHTDLAGRVFGLSTNILVDTDGHGTHVAGIIAGNGTNSLTVTNAYGSVMPPTNGQFRGMAPQAKLFANDFQGPGDFELQEAAARTNALISNNSWGYGTSDYNIAAASFDAAVRDSLPETEGSQPLIYVFAAGNSGNGSTDGEGATPGTVLSPGNAKNVITVGALEQARNITNSIEIVQEGVTNTSQPWADSTDSDNQVAYFSSRGNVGVNIEGDFGRFKPDVVAPGTFVVSTRSSQWNQTNYYNPTYHHFTTFTDDVKTNSIQVYPIFLPFNTVQLNIEATPINPAGTNLSIFPIYINTDGNVPSLTDTPAGTNSVTWTGSLLNPLDTFWLYGIGNATNRTISYRVTTDYITTNDFGNYFTVLSNMNEQLGPYYRYESGTSMAAPAVSGVLALMEDYFTNRLQMRPSPALMKAMLINGARTVNAQYDLQVKKELNDQGWGVVNLTNSLPAGLTNNLTGKSTMLFFDQSPTNALATGDSRTINISVDPSAAARPLRVTLVWTDPPGNPAAGIKLVNDLDLVVTNLDTPTNPIVYVGNDIPAGSSFTFPFDTNAIPNWDRVNNVENVFVRDPLGTNYSITVIAHRVNVNAVTANTNNVVQDFALVISTGNGETNALLLATNNPIVSVTAPELTAITNDFAGITNISGQLLLNQRVGANPPLMANNSIALGTNTVWADGGTNGLITLGATNQWHFYVITNTTTFSNAAFATFLPPTLSLPRMGVTNYDNPEEATRVEADIDLFVSTNAALMNLDPNVVATADKSLRRGGNEFIVYSNAVQNEVYYIGVHSEDRLAAEYAFFGAFSLEPFSQDDNGAQIVRGINVPANIPDGTPGVPGGLRVIGIAVSPMEIRKVVVTNELSHQNMGDLFGVLTHEQQSVVLNNHSCAMNPATSTCFTNHTFIYDDTGENNVTGAQHTDGPGDLRGFNGQPGEGVWFLTEVDNALGNTGRVENLTIRLEPQNLEDGLNMDIAPNSFGYASLNVPPEATNMLIEIASTLPVQLYVKRGDFPSQTDYDYTWPVTGGSTTNQFVIDKNSIPPLRSGRYYFGVYNPNSSFVHVWIKVTLTLDVKPIATTDFTMFGPQTIPDDAISYSTIHVPYDRTIARVDVGLAIQHPRISDMALTLISPSGKRILLSENRGGNSSDMGFINVQTNVFPAVIGDPSTPHPTADTNSVPLFDSNNVLITSGVLVIDYNFFNLPDSLDVYYEGTNIFSSGGYISGGGTQTIPFGPGTATNLLIVINQNGNPQSQTAWEYTNSIVSVTGSYFTFSENTNRARLPIKFAVPPFTGTNFGSSSMVSAVTGWTQWPVSAGGNDHWYKGVLTSNAISWAEASQLATNDGGYLATITSSAEDAIVFPLINSSAYFRDWAGHGIGPAIGGIRTNITANPSDGWGWITGEAWGAYLRWAPNQPDNNQGTGADEDRLYYWDELSLAPADSWNDFPSGVTAPAPGAYVVEHDPVTYGSETNFTYYFPEESLKALVGDNAQGEWKLEMWDNRAGGSASNTPPQLLSWQLRFIFDDLVPSATPLTHGVPVTNTLAPCQIAYYFVDVPAWAQFVTNSLLFATAPVNVWINTNGLPGLGGTNVGDVALFGSNPQTNALTVLSTTTNSNPVLVPGARYFIGIENPCGSGVTNLTFAFQVDFNITALSDGIPVTGTNIGNALPRYFYYEVSTNATAVSFQLTNMSGNFDLVARRGAPLPTTSSYDYGSFNPGTVDEEILVFTNSNPVALKPGRWYLGVYNTSLASNVFTIVATEFTNSFANIITLTNGIPYTNSASAGASQYYRYVVSSSGVRVQFEINNPSGDMALYASKGLPLPDSGNHDYFSDNPFLNDELITVFTNSSPVSLRSGDWFLTAANVSGGPVTYSIKATEWTTTGQPITVTGFTYNPPDGTFTNGSFCITWSSLPGVHYFVEGNSDLATTNWVAVSPTITATDYTTTYCVGITPGNRFFRVVEGVALSSFAPPQNFAISVNTNGFLLQWRGAAAAQYQLQWTTNLAAPTTWTAFSPTNITSTNLFAPHSFTNGIYSFLDDGAQTNGPALPRPSQTFYRVLLLP